MLLLLAGDFEQARVRKEKGEKGLGAQEEQVRREARCGNRGNNPPCIRRGPGLGTRHLHGGCLPLGFWTLRLNLARKPVTTTWWLRGKGRGCDPKRRMCMLRCNIDIYHICVASYIFTHLYSTIHAKFFEGAIPNWFAFLYCSNKFSRPPIAGWLEKCTWPNLCWAFITLLLGPMLSEDTWQVLKAPQPKPIR